MPEYVATARKTVTATIASGAALSNVIDVRGYRVAGIMMPGTWTAAKVSFRCCDTSGGTFLDVYNDANAEVSMDVTAAKVHMINTLRNQLSGLSYIKLRSGVTATPVNQAADREITLILSGD